MNETNLGQQDIILTKGRAFKMDNFNNAFSSFTDIRSKLESSEVMLNLYESIKEYLQLLRADINESDTNTLSHRLLFKNIDLIDRYLQTILRTLVIESVKTQSIKKTNRWKRKCLKYSSKMDILTYTRTSFWCFLYFDIVNGNKSEVTTNHLKPIYVLVHLLEGFSTILKKVLLLY